MKKILIIILNFLICISLNFLISYSYYEPGSNEYKQRENEAMNIINSINPSTTNEIVPTKYVYVTSNGSKYHLYGCDEINSTPHKIELVTAINKGYAPCKICNPYDLASAEIIEEQTEMQNNSKFIIFIIIILLFLITYIVFNEIRYKKLKRTKEKKSNDK